MEIQFTDSWANYAAMKSIEPDVVGSYSRLFFECRKCGDTFPHWFESAGKTLCNCCEAIRRYPDRVRPLIDEFRARLLLVAESKHLRRTTGQNRCQACGVIHDHDETRPKRWRHVCKPCERLHIRIYRQTQRAKKRDGIGNTIRKAIRAGRESPTVRDALGYTIAELRLHLERQFTTGMTWDRFIAGEIHIDHITAQARFDISDPEQWRSCWSLGNLRPMWGLENIAKRDRATFLL